MDNSGWIKLHRKSFDNFLYKENRPLSKREAWEDILLRVNYVDGDSLMGNEKIICKRGQSTMSLDTWGKIFNWDKSKVKRFFDLLQNNSMIVVENLHKTTRVTVCKYEDYQGDRNGTETHLKRKRNASETEVKPIEEGKEEEELKEYNNIEFDCKNISSLTWNKWIDYKKAQFKFKYKNQQSEQIALNELIQISNNDPVIADKIVNHSIANGYKGLFELKTNGIYKINGLEKNSHNLKRV